MGRHHIGTSIPKWWDYVVNTNEYITGSWPNLGYHIDFSFQWYSRANPGSIAVNNMDYKFHTSTQRVATHITVGSGQFSNAMCSGAFDLAWATNSRSQMHVLGTSVSSSYISGSGNIGVATLTIPEGSLSATLANVTHNSATVNISYTSPYNFWVVKIYNTTGALYKDNCTNGANTITNLSPGKNYTFNVELWGRDGSVIVRRQITLRTTGFSYIDSTSVTIGKPLNVTLKTYDNSFTNTVTLKIGGNSYYTKSDIKSTNLQYPLSITFTEQQIQDIYKLIPNDLKIDGTLTIHTYENGGLLGTTENKITFNVDPSLNQPVIKNVTYKDISSAVDKTGNDQWVIEDISKVVVNCQAESKNHATIKKYVVEIENNLYENNEGSISTNKLITSDTGIYVTVIDSRGLQTVIHEPYAKFIMYKKPEIISAEVTRINDVEESTRLKLKGRFDRLSINEIDKNITLLLKYRYKLTSSTTWETYVIKELNINNNEFTYDNIIQDFDADKAYDFEIYVSDYFYNTTNTATLLKGKFELFIGDGYVEVNGTFYYNDKPLLDVMYPVGIVIEFGKDINPNTLFANTKWEVYGEGRGTMGYIKNDTEFGTIGKIGGYRKHTLTMDEMPKHNHAFRVVKDNETNSKGDLPKACNSQGNNNGWSSFVNNSTGNNAVDFFGGSMPHNNLQPYIVVCRWIRVA